MYSLESIEKKQNVKFPEEYKTLYQSNFKEIDSRIEICVGEDRFCINKFLNAIEINEVLEEFYDFFGYDIIPIAETDYDDYICLYYKKNKDIPSIVHWNYELALENAEEGILLLYDNMHDFKNVLNLSE